MEESDKNEDENLELPQKELNSDYDSEGWESSTSYVIDMNDKHNEYAPDSTESESESTSELIIDEEKAEREMKHFYWENSDIFNMNSYGKNYTDYFERIENEYKAKEDHYFEKTSSSESLDSVE